MKRTAFILFAIMISVFVNAQSVTRPSEDPMVLAEYGVGSTETITKTTDPNNLTEITTTEIKDNSKAVRRIIIEKKKLDGKVERIETDYSPGGKKWRSDSISRNSKGDTTYFEHHLHYGDRQVEKHITIYNEDGSKTNKHKPYDSNTFTTTEIPAPNAPKKDKVKAFSKIDVTAGYSFLSMDNGMDHTGIPLGFNFGVGYNITDKLSLGAGFSFHSKKDDPATLNRFYITGSVEYDLLTKGRFTPFVAASVGIASEKYKISDMKFSESGFLAAIGAGTDVSLSPTAAFRFRIDVLLNRLTEETLTDYRVSGGIVIHLSEIFGE